MDLAVLKVKPHYIFFNPFRRQIIGDAYGQTFYTTWDCLIKNKKDKKNSRWRDCLFFPAVPCQAIGLSSPKDFIMIQLSSLKELQTKALKTTSHMFAGLSFSMRWKNMLMLNLCKIYNDGNGLIKMWWLPPHWFFKLSRVCVFLSDQFDLMIWWYEDLMIWWFNGLMIWWFDDLMIRWLDDLTSWWFDAYCLIEFLELNWICVLLSDNDLMIWWYDD